MEKRECEIAKLATDPTLRHFLEQSFTVEGDQVPEEIEPEEVKLKEVKLEQDDEESSHDSDQGVGSLCDFYGSEKEDDPEWGDYNLFPKTEVSTPGVI